MIRYMICVDCLKSSDLLQRKRQRQQVWAGNEQKSFMKPNETKLYPEVVEAIIIIKQ